ncbi:undecaprenyl-diphosphate phosphatase [Sodalis sp. CWE]|uniref:undecaprenyl-diphosphate phosphatase n=1 Tax=Sodalis sp. CWE TaxID=2803816 RepID=UPI001C7CDC6A|nr:undecaprenyl-diphosphate phosphatase [Sodalis sp. CWE]MBX4180825.1 undecaprenyl-diphosphate phosphatase [Sodalis sp. CWE]
MHDSIIAFIFGILEGITEFLPISSTGHIILVGNLLGFMGNKAKSFETVVQLGSILAIVKVFWERLFNLTKTYLEKIYRLEYNHLCNKSSQLNFNHILLGVTPSVIVGSICYEQIKSIYIPIYVMYALIAGGMLLLAGEWIKLTVISRTENINELTYLQAFLIGCFQCLAFWPGFSRSGATISGGLIVNVSRYAASEFSFILAIPTLLGASMVDLYKNLPFLVWQDFSMFIIGFTTAFLVARLSVKLFLRIIRHVSFVPFAIYRFFLAAMIYWSLAG